MNKSKKNTKIFLKIHQKNTKRFKDIKRIKKNKTKLKSKNYYGGSNNIYNDIENTLMISEFYRNFNTNKLYLQNKIFLQKKLKDYKIAVNIKQSNKNSINSSQMSLYSLKQNYLLYKAMIELLLNYLNSQNNNNNRVKQNFNDLKKLYKSYDEEIRQYIQAFINNNISNNLNYNSRKKKEELKIYILYHLTDYFLKNPKKNTYLTINQHLSYIVDFLISKNQIN